MGAKNQIKGEKGHTFRSSTTVTTGNFESISIVADAVFTTLTDSTAAGYTVAGDAKTGVTFPAGMTLHGLFTAFTLTSGTVIAYNK